MFTDWLTWRVLISFLVGILVGAGVLDVLFTLLHDNASMRWFASRNLWYRVAAYGIIILFVVIATESLVKAMIALVGLGLVWLAFWLKGRNGTATSRTATATGNLKITLIDKPAFKNAAVKVTFPDGTVKTVNRSMTLRGLEPGAYSIVADTLKVGQKEFEPDVAVNSVTVTASRMAKLTITYTEA